MCSSYSGTSGTGIGAYIKDRFGGGKSKGGGVSTGGASGPSAVNAMATSYIRQKATAPNLDDQFGVSNG